MSYRVRCVLQASLNILSREPRISIQQFLDASAFRQFAEQKLPGMRVFRITGLPSITAGSISIRSYLVLLMRV